MICTFYVLLNLFVVLNFKVVSHFLVINLLGIDFCVWCEVRTFLLFFFSISVSNSPNKIC